MNALPDGRLVSPRGLAPISQETDLLVRLDERVFGNVVLGRMPFAEAVERGAIHFEGPPALVRAFPTWLGVTGFTKYAVVGSDTTLLGAVMPAV